MFPSPDHRPADDVVVLANRLQLPPSLGIVVSVCDRLYHGGWRRHIPVNPKAVCIAVSQDLCPNVPIQLSPMNVCEVFKVHANSEPKFSVLHLRNVVLGEPVLHIFIYQGLVGVGQVDPIGEKGFQVFDFSNEFRHGGGISVDAPCRGGQNF